MQPELPHVLIYCTPGANTHTARILSQQKEATQ